MDYDDEGFGQMAHPNPTMTTIHVEFYVRCIKGGRL